MLTLSDRHVANIDEEAIRQMGRNTKHKWINRFDRLHKVYQKEDNPVDQGQPVITQHFKVVEGRKCTRKAGSRKPRTAQRPAKRKLAQSTL
jgi:hypothetical protein